MMRTRAPDGAKNTSLFHWFRWQQSLTRAVPPPSPPDSWQGRQSSSFCSCPLLLLPGEQQPTWTGKTWAWKPDSLWQVQANHPGRPTLLHAWHCTAGGETNKTWTKQWTFPSVGPQPLPITQKWKECQGAQISRAILRSSSTHSDSTAHMDLDLMGWALWRKWPGQKALSNFRPNRRTAWFTKERNARLRSTWIKLKGNVNVFHGLFKPTKT